MGKAQIWQLTHRERAAMVDTLAELKPDQWAEPSLVAGWSVHVAAAHILAGAEQTPLHFTTVATLGEFEGEGTGTLGFPIDRSSSHRVAAAAVSADLHAGQCRRDPGVVPGRRPQARRLPA